MGSGRSDDFALLEDWSSGQILTHRWDVLVDTAPRTMRPDLNEVHIDVDELDDQTLRIEWNERLAPCSEVKIEARLEDDGGLSQAGGEVKVAVQILDWDQDDDVNLDPQLECKIRNITGTGRLWELRSTGTGQVASNSISADTWYHIYAGVYPMLGEQMSVQGRLTDSNDAALADSISANELNSNFAQDKFVGYRFRIQVSSDVDADTTGTLKLGKVWVRK